MRSELSTTDYAIIGGYIDATLAASALTVSIKTTAGNDPSPLEPVYIGFRSSSLSSGIPSVCIVTSPTSVTAPSNKLVGILGTSIPFRLWVTVFNNAGVARLALINSLVIFGSNLYVFSLSEFGVASSLDISVNGDAGGVFLSDTASVVTSKPYRLVALLDWNTGRTSITSWVSPDTITPKSASILNPGTPFGPVISRILTSSSGPTTIPYDDTIPTSSEGNSIVATAITPTSPINLIRNYVNLSCSSTVAEHITVALFKDSDASAFAAVPVYVPAANSQMQIILDEIHQAATTTSVTFTIRAGAETGTFRIDGAGGGRKLGGVIQSFHQVQEIMV